MTCPRCKNKEWNPIDKCQHCEYSIGWALRNPSEYQSDEKWPKHGLLYNGTETIVDPDAWDQNTPGSKFLPNIDISSVWTMVASSGEIVIPRDGNRSMSVMFDIGELAGGGYLDKQFQYFYSARIVKPDDTERIHIFPDTLRTIVDKEVVCPNCDESYSINQRPEYCSCGRRFKVRVI